MKYSKYQVAFHKEVKTGTGHILGEALAGTGKTTTSISCLPLIPLHYNTAVLAFSSDIVKEISPKVKSKRPNNTWTLTLHSMGLKILKRFNPHIKLLKGSLKYRNALKGISDFWEYPEGDKERKKFLKDLYQLQQLLRLYLIPIGDDDALKDLARKYNIIPKGNLIQYCFDVVAEMNRNLEEIDYTDMIYLPCYLKDKVQGLKFPKFQFIIVDEAQDLNRAQQQLIDLITDEKIGRQMYIGDQYQAIFGFAGADSDSFSMLKRKKNINMLPLHECYRCPKKHIEWLNEEFPEIPIKAYEGNIDGAEPKNGSWKELKDDDFVLCRNTAPLVRFCFHLIKEGKAASILGRGIEDSLKKVVKDSKCESVGDLFSYLDDSLKKLAASIVKDNEDIESEQQAINTEIYQKQKDTCDVIKLIATHNTSVKNCSTLIYAIDALFKDKKGIKLATCHKSKGLEADRVFILEPDLMPSKYAKQEWQLEQERNLKYVAFTRCKEQMFFINDWFSKDKMETPAPKSSQYIGEIGEFIPLELTVKSRFKNKNSESYIYNLVDNESNVFVKFGNIPKEFYIEEDVNGLGVVVFEGKITRHNEFRGVKQTCIGSVRLCLSLQE